MATDRQLDYIESLLDSTGLTLSVATRGLLGRSVSIDGVTLGEASELIDYLKSSQGSAREPLRADARLLVNARCGWLNYARS